MRAIIRGKSKVLTSFLTLGEALFKGGKAISPSLCAFRIGHLEHIPH